MGGGRVLWGDWRVIRDKINGTKKLVLTYDYQLYFGLPTQQCNILVLKTFKYIPILKDKESE